MTQQREDLLPLTAELEVITGVADDFGHLVHRVPAAVAKPGNQLGVKSVVKYAVEQGITVVPRGAGHSVYGQAQCDGGIVCDLSRLNYTWMRRSRVTADAGATWSQVLETTLQKGLTPPVLPDYLELTVGGTLSVGGIGGGSHRYGPQVDNVTQLRVVTATGELVTCSPLERPEVFFAALAGGGQGGIITDATFTAIPARQRACVQQIQYPSAGELVAAQLGLANGERADHLEGQIALGEVGGWQFTAEVATFHDGDVPCLDGAEDMSYLEFCQRMAPGVRLLAASGAWYRPHPWISVFLPVANVEQYVNYALSELTPETLGPVPVLLYPMRRGTVPAPGLKAPEGELFFAFSILRTAATDIATEEALAHNTRLAEAAIAAGGTIYPISAVPR